MMEIVLANINPAIAFLLGQWIDLTLQAYSGTASFPEPIQFPFEVVDNFRQFENSFSAAKLFHLGLVKLNLKFVSGSHKNSPFVDELALQVGLQTSR